MMSRTVIASFVFCLLAGIVLPQTPETDGVLATESVITEQVKSIGCRLDDRLDAVKELFSKQGAKDVDIKYVGKKNKKSLVVTVPGNEDVIVIGAHFDAVNEGCGVIDNWSGIVIIANMYRSIRHFETKKTIRFIAFGGEEEGLKGSKNYVKSLKREGRKSICAMLNFDSFGLAYPQIDLNGADRGLVKIAEKSAKVLKIPLNKARIRGGTSDHASFAQFGIPVIAFHGLSEGFWSIIHTSKDKFETVKPRSVYLGYRFGLKFLYEVERMPCRKYKGNAKKK